MSYEDNHVIKALTESQHTDVITLIRLNEQKTVARIAGFDDNGKKIWYLVTIETEEA